MRPCRGWAIAGLFILAPRMKAPPGGPVCQKFRAPAPCLREQKPAASARAPRARSRPPAAGRRNSRDLSQEEGGGQRPTVRGACAWRPPLPGLRRSGRAADRRTATLERQGTVFKGRGGALSQRGPSSEQDPLKILVCTYIRIYYPKSPISLNIANE